MHLPGLSRGSPGSRQHDAAGRTTRRSAGVQLDLATVQSNIVIFRMEEGAPDAATIVARAQESGILVSAFGERIVRAVTHLDVSGDQSGAPPTCSPKSSSAAELAGALAQQDLLFAGEDELSFLVVHGSGKRDDAGRALRRQRGDLEHRVERV